MNKAFLYFLWENFPSVNTALNDYHLNLINKGLNEVDDRVIQLDATKVSLLEISTLFKDISFDEKTGILTFTRYNGATVKIDTPMEKIQTGIYYNPETEKLVLPLIDGTSMEVDLSRLMKFDEFIDSDTIAFTVNPNGTITAAIKKGSITEEYLQPNYLADIKVQAGLAETSMQRAEQAAEIAESAKEDVAANAAAAGQAKETAESAAETATTKADEANISALKASASEKNASDSEAEAKISETNAKASEESAKESEEKAAASEKNARDSALLAKSWAVDGTGIREGEETDNAKYYCQTAHGYRDEAEQFSQSATDAVEQINKKLEMAEFDIDDDGNLIYTDGSSYDFTVDDNGDLNWGVAA